MKINERALKAIKEAELNGEKIVEDLLPAMAQQMEDFNAKNVDLTLGFDKDGKAPVGELVPTIIIRLAEKTEE